MTGSSPRTNFERAAAAIRTNRRYDDEAAFYTNSRSLHVKLFLAAPLTIAAGALVAYLGLATALQIATLGGLALIGYRFWHGQRISIKSVVLFVVGVFGVYVASIVLGHRLLAAGILAAATFILFELWGRRPIDFFREYLIADSVYTTEQQRDLPVQSVGPNRLTLLLILAVIVFVPWLHSTTFAVILLCLLCPAILFFHSTKAVRPAEQFKLAIRTARFIITEYLTYPDVPAGIPTWAPLDPCQSRRRAFTVLWLSLASTMMVGVSYCIPWELFASYFQDGFQWSVPPERAPYYSWLIAPFARATSASSGYRWAFAVGAVLSFLLPYVVLFTLYFPAIQNAVQAMLAVEEMKRLDPRTEYERLVDRTLDSELVEG